MQQPSINPQWHHPLVYHCEASGFVFVLKHNTAVLSIYSWQNEHHAASEKTWNHKLVREVFAVVINQVISNFLISYYKAVLRTGRRAIVFF